MKLSEFDYILPPELIAQYPLEPRDSSKLLCVQKNGQMKDTIFSDLENILWKNDVLVMNKTRVIKARLKGTIKDTGKKCEIFLHKQVSENVWDCLVYPGKKLKPWIIINFISPSPQKGEDWSEVWLEAKIQEISEKWRIVEFSQSGQQFLDTIESIGETPLPPYIKDASSNPERYQTVYNDVSQSGSVAAPTAGLHFTPELLKKLKNKWVQIEYVTLHVGIGTFGNVETDDIKEHNMHSETIILDSETKEKLNEYKTTWKRIIAVGTTSVRTLESFAKEKWVLESGQKETSIFIYPGYEWLFVDGIITNFHLPKSTLLMLVSSFSGQDTIKKAYSHAISSGYRFFSFGDAMLLTE